ncbi:11023_t:CDS:1, partial [Entrophospora sp. SA101]
MVMVIVRVKAEVMNIINAATFLQHHLHQNSKMKDHQVTKKSSDSSSNKSSSSINATAEFELNSFVTIDTTIDYE